MVIIYKDAKRCYKDGSYGMFCKKTFVKCNVIPLLYTLLKIYIQTIQLAYQAMTQLFCQLISLHPCFCWCICVHCHRHMQFSITPSKVLQSLLINVQETSMAHGNATHNMPQRMLRPSEGCIVISP